VYTAAVLFERIFIMAQIDLSKTQTKAELKCFKGIDRSAPVHSGGLEYISNFRIGTDGSLVKRHGFEQHAKFSLPIRAIFRLSDSSIAALSGDKIYSVDLLSDTFTELASVGTSDGNASFFKFGQALYLADGNSISEIGGNGATAIDGYAPLYGKDWDPKDMGEVNEELNILSHHLRISYKIGSSSPSYFYLPFQISSIDAVFLNGERRASGSASLSSDGTKIQSILSLHEGDTVAFFLSTQSTATDNSALMHCKGAIPVGTSKEGISLIFFDGDDPSAIYCAHTASSESVKVCSSVYPSALSLYAKASDRITIDGGKGAVTAVCTLSDRLIVFTEERAFFLDPHTSTGLSLIPSGVGCLSKNGLSFVGGELFTVSRGGVFKWHISSRSDTDCSVACISRRVADLLPYSFCANAVLFTSISTDELFIGDPDDPSGTVLVYSIGSDSWYSFSGIGAEHFFECAGKVGFTRSDSICLFSPDMTHDTVDGKKINVISRIESGLLMCDPINDQKRLSHLFMLTSKGASLKLTVTDAEGHSQSLYLSDNSSERLGYLESRLECRRSRYYSFSIEDSTDQAVKLYTVVLSAVD